MAHTVKLLSVRDEHVFMAYQGGSKNQFSLPGGKTKLRPRRKKPKKKQAPRRKVEKPLRTLKRELKAEFPKLKVKKYKFWKRFWVRTAEGHSLMTVYTGEVSGRADAEEEIDGGMWVRIDRIEKLPKSSSSTQALEAYKYELNGYRKR